MTVGDRRIAARIEPRDKAKQDFAKAKREGKSASLLEEDRPNVFTMQVANVMPNDVIAVELKYTELLLPHAGAYEVVYPTVVGPRYSSKSQAKAAESDQFVASPYLHEAKAPPSELHFSAKLSGGVPLQDLGCATHPLAIRWDGPTRAELTLAEADRFTGNRDVVVRYRLAGTDIGSGVLLYRGRDENFFLTMVEPAAATPLEALPPREYIFVLDVSGSMNGFPLDTAKGLMTDLAHGLRPVDRFNVVLFADGSNVLAPSSLPATGDNLSRALSFIGPQSGGGGTELLAALKRAAAIPRPDGIARTVVLVTDGFIEAEKDVFGYVRDHLDQSSVFAFGIGTSVNRYLIEGIAKAGQGEPLIITQPAEAHAAAAKFRAYIDSPVLAGVRVTFAGFDAYDVEPAKVPDLFTGRPIVVHGKWRGEPRGSVTVTGRRGTGDFRASYPISDAALRGDHQALPYLWARARIAELSDYGSTQQEPADVARITELGLHYHLLTPYTSFVAVHEVVRNPGGTGDDAAQALPLPVGVSDLAVGESVQSGDEPELLWITAALALLVAAHMVKNRRAQDAGALATS
jgi:Ca-activated chloride channel family protein